MFGLVCVWTVHRIHGNEHGTDRITVFIFTTASSAVFEKSDNKTRCAFEGSRSLWIYVKCICALTFPHYGETSLCQDHVRPISIALCWRRPDTDSHLNTHIHTHTQPSALRLKRWREKRLFISPLKRQAHLHWLFACGCGVCKCEGDNDDGEQRDGRRYYCTQGLIQ